jgi:hypothetical protein
MVIGIEICYSRKPTKCVGTSERLTCPNILEALSPTLREK